MGAFSRSTRFTAIPDVTHVSVRHYPSGDFHNSLPLSDPLYSPSPIVFSKDETRIAVGNGTGIDLFDVSSGELLNRFECGSTMIRNPMIFSPDGNRLLVLCDTVLWMWDLRSGKTQQVDLANTRHSQSPDFLRRALACNGSAVAIAGPGGLELRNLDSVQQPGTFLSHDAIECVAFSPDGELLVSGDDAGRIAVWDANTEACVHTSRLIPRVEKSLATPVLLLGLWVVCVEMARWLPNPKKSGSRLLSISAWRPFSRKRVASGANGG